MNTGTSELTRLEISFHSLKGVIFSKDVEKKKEKSSYPYLLLRYELKETLLSDLFHICYKNSKTEKFSGALFYFLFLFFF